MARPARARPFHNASQNQSRIDAMRPSASSSEVLGALHARSRRATASPPGVWALNGQTSTIGVATQTTPSKVVTPSEIVKSRFMVQPHATQNLCVGYVFPQRAHGIPAGTLDE